MLSNNYCHSIGGYQDFLNNKFKWNNLNISICTSTDHLNNDRDTCYSIFDYISLPKI